MCFAVSCGDSRGYILPPALGAVQGVALSRSRFAPPPRGPGYKALGTHTRLSELTTCIIFVYRWDPMLNIYCGFRENLGSISDFLVISCGAEMSDYALRAINPVAKYPYFCGQLIEVGSYLHFPCINDSKYSKSE